MKILINFSNNSCIRRITIFINFYLTKIDLILKKVEKYFFRYICLSDFGDKFEVPIDFQKK